MISEESKKKLLCLADWLEKKVDPTNFNMTSWTNEDFEFISAQDVTPECGTTCCIAGWVALTSGAKLRGGEVLTAEGVHRSADAFAGEKLGLDEGQYSKLFYPTSWPRAHGFFGNRPFPNTPKGAAARIRYFVETGQ